MRALLLSLLFVSATAGAAAAPAYVSFKGRAPVVNRAGYTITLPQQGLWLEHATGDRIVYLKETGDGEATLFVAVEDIALPQALPAGQALRDVVRARLEPDGDANAATEPVVTRLRMDARLPGCVRWKQTAEDLLSENPETRSHPQVQLGGLFCVNAGNPATAFQVSYSIRRMAPEQPDQLTAQGEAFLSGVRRKTP